MDDVTTITNACAFCGRSLTESKEPYVIRNGLGEISAFHINCQEIFNGYIHMRNQHDALCHLVGCTKGPTNPFKS